MQSNGTKYFVSITSTAILTKSQKNQENAFTKRSRKTLTKTTDINTGRCDI